LFALAAGVGDGVAGEGLISAAGLTSAVATVCCVLTSLEVDTTEGAGVVDVERVEAVTGSDCARVEPRSAKAQALATRVLLTSRTVPAVFARMDRMRRFSAGAGAVG